MKPTSRLSICKASLLCLCTRRDPQVDCVLFFTGLASGFENMAATPKLENGKPCTVELLAHTLLLLQSLRLVLSVSIDDLPAMHEQPLSDGKDIAAR